MMFRAYITPRLGASVQGLIPKVAQFFKWSWKVVEFLLVLEHILESS